MRDPLPNFPGYALRRAANATAAELSARLADTGLRQSDVSVLMLIVYGGLIGLTYVQFARTPSGFIPPLDRAYFIAAISLPPGASLHRPGGRPPGPKARVDPSSSCSRS